MNHLLILILAAILIILVFFTIKNKHFKQNLPFIGALAVIIIYLFTFICEISYNKVENIEFYNKYSELIKENKIVDNEQLRAIEDYNNNIDKANAHVNNIFYGVFYEDYAGLEKLNLKQAYYSYSRNYTNN